MTMPPHAALAVDPRCYGLCAVSPARGCGAGRGVGRRGMMLRLLPDAGLHRRRRKRERGTSGRWKQSGAVLCSAKPVMHEGRPAPIFHGRHPPTHTLRLSRPQP